MITREEYKKAFVEVLEILKYLSIEEISKIPKKRIDIMEKEKDKTYIFKIDRTKTLKDQNFSPVTKSIIANFYRDYWATEYEKKIIKAKQKFDMDRKEQEKLEKYREFIKKRNKK